MPLYVLWHVVEDVMNQKAYLGHEEQQVDVGSVSIP